MSRERPGLMRSYIIIGTHAPVTSPVIVPLNSGGATPTTVNGILLSVTVRPMIPGSPPNLVADDDDLMRAGRLILFG